MADSDASGRLPAETLQAEADDTRSLDELMPPSPKQATKAKHNAKPAATNRDPLRQHDALREQVNRQQQLAAGGGGGGGGRQRRPMTEAEMNAARERHRQRVAVEQERQMELELKHGADQVLALIIPVSLCMLVVILTIRSVSFYSTNDTQFVYAPYEENDEESTGERFGGALLNVVIIIGIIVVMTCFLVVLYKYRCYKAIHGWLIMSSLLLLFYFSYDYITQVLQAFNETIDWITLMLIVWNFGCVGMVCIHWKGPLVAQQLYLIAVSSLMALVLIKNLPAWTTWILLAAIAVYDLIAVLCPRGPLRMLVETAQERDEPLFPALIYSSTMMWFVPAVGMGMANGGANRGAAKEVEDDDRDVETFGGTGSIQEPAPSAAQQQQQQQRAQQQRAQQQQQPSAEEEEEGRGVKLGLGDFIFYSVLVGKAATSDSWTTIFSCYVGILIGLACTLLLLSIYQKALPALPISIFFGIVFFFTTSALVDPLVDRLSENQIFL